mmetsp:Transcript_9333/g.19833  ORF Transcript_9333/g.19833 Transcript_9333/m.19833 type:complete len:199 (+) Transcript_9333:79-675(+)
MNHETSFTNATYFPPVKDLELEWPAEWEALENDPMLVGTVQDSFGVSTSAAEEEDKLMAHYPLELDYNFDDDQDMPPIDSSFHTHQRLEELFDNALYFENDGDFQNTVLDQGGFFVETDYDYPDDSSIGLPLEERYKATLEKLQASMKRSQETRNCLTMKTATTESYERVGSVKEILSSIATSSGQVQQYVTSIQRPI